MLPDVIVTDPDIHGGVPVFAGTRVPVRTLFDYLEDDFTLTEFLEFFPTVPRSLAVAVLEAAETKIDEESQARPA